ncbi:EF-hand domain-containing protein [bacterium]|nr:EF-hand domain-containing protein [bacterium]
MKLGIPLIAILSLCFLAAEVTAQPTAAQSKGKRSAQGKSGAKGKAGGKSRSGEKGKGRAGQGGQRDIGQMVARMMKEFDKDGDQKLNTTELTALMKTMQERRGGQMGQQSRAGQRPGDSEKAKGKGKGKGKNKSKSSDAPATGGQKPKRPDSDG